MAIILYYSNYCEYSKDLLQYLTKQNFSSIKYLCIDRRYNKDGNTYILLESQQPIILPKLISREASCFSVGHENKLVADCRHRSLSSHARTLHSEEEMDFHASRHRWLRLGYGSSLEEGPLVFPSVSVTEGEHR